VLTQRLCVGSKRREVLAVVKVQSPGSANYLDFLQAFYALPNHNLLRH
jgi:hypothetical protein